MMIFAIDPGNVESAFVLMDEDYLPVHFGKLPNEEVRNELFDAMCCYKLV